MLLPYYLIVHEAKTTLSILSENNVYNDFINKILKYAELFKGDHLRIVTAHVLLRVLQLDQSKASSIAQLINSYGHIEPDEWQDES